MIKIVTKVGTERIYLSIIKVIYDKPTTKIILNIENLEAFLLYTGTKTGCHSHHFYSM